MLQVIPLNEGRDRLIAEASFLAERVEFAPLLNAAGRTLAREVSAREDIPGFTRSSVDGWAVLAADTFGATAALPALLRFADEVKMGGRATRPAEPGACVKVWTGGEVPRGADAMVMLEDAEELPGGLVAVYTPTAPGRHLVFRGDDAAAGQTVIHAGIRLSPREIGALAAIGIAEVPVRARPRVKILSTGDELIDPAKTPQYGQIRDCNGPMLAAASEEAGAMAEFCGRVPDDEAALKERMQTLAEDCDVLLLSGGSSAGAKDAVARCLGELGRVFFHGLAVKPGKPTLAGAIGETIVVGLPGHPSAAYLVFLALVRPLLAAMQGERLQERTISAALAFAVASNHGREELVPVLLDGDTATAVPSKSGLITTLTRANGYIRVPREREGLSKGTRVDVILF